MAGLRKFRSAAVSKSWPVQSYRAGTGAGGRNEDRAVLAAGFFAAARLPLSMDSR
jgi:hypothetical protein